jgi:hypothetical protein
LADHGPLTRHEKRRPSRVGIASEGEDGISGYVLIPGEGCEPVGGWLQVGRIGRHRAAKAISLFGELEAIAGCLGHVVAALALSVLFRETELD